MLLPVIMLAAACDNADNGQEEEWIESAQGGVFVLCEGNFNAGNSTLSYYDPESRTVQNGVFQRVNDRKLGDTGQSIVCKDGMAYIAMENSGIVWKINTKDFRVQGYLTAGQTEQMINPRYVHMVDDHKAYVTDLYAPYITVFDPSTMQYIRSIATGQASNRGYCSTEQMVQHGQYVFTNCWSYSRNILVIDTHTDQVVDSIVLNSWQPKSMKLDARGKLWVITDGGYTTTNDSFGDDVPHLYRIDAATRQIESDQALDTDESSVQIALNPSGNVLYVINNDIYRMNVTDNHLPVRPFIEAPRDEQGRRHKLYGIDVNPHNGEIYVADAVDYRQSGVVYRYAEDGQLMDQFRVGILPNGFAFN